MAAAPGTVVVVGLMGMPMADGGGAGVDFVVLAWPTPDAVAPPFVMTKRRCASGAVRTNAQPMST